MRIFKTIIVYVLIGAFMVPGVSLAQIGELGEKKGNHSGEEPPFEYWVEYLNPLGVTTVDEAGITFAPFNSSPSFLADDIPEEYFGDYPLYFSGDTVNFRVHIKNLDRRTYRNLLVLVQQEFFNKDGGVGEAFGQPALNEWFIEELAPGQEVILKGSVKITGVSGSGLDQTHLQILHWPQNSPQTSINGGGQIILDDAQAGIWCPL